MGAGPIYLGPWAEFRRERQNSRAVIHGKGGLSGIIPGPRPLPSPARTDLAPPRCAGQGPLAP